MTNRTLPDYREIAFQILLKHEDKYGEIPNGTLPLIRSIELELKDIYIKAYHAGKLDASENWQGEWDGYYRCQHQAKEDTSEEEEEA